MDLRHLRFDDEAFDAVVACSPLRVLDGLQGVAQAAYELGRVLRPGGLALLQVELALGGPPGESGWSDDLPLISAEEVRRYLVGASGLELVGPVQWAPSPATQRLPRDLTQHPEDFDLAHDRPNQVIQIVGGYVACPLHLVLRKTTAYPAAENAWAMPTESVVRAAQQRAVDLALSRSQPVSLRSLRRSRRARIPEPPPQPAPLLRLARHVLSEKNLIKIRAVYRQMLDRLPKPLALRLGRLALRVGLVERV
jgi:SAM-dependent methyltransferase